MNRHMNIKTASRAQMLLYKAAAMAERYALTHRERRALARSGIRECRAGASLGRALSIIEQQARGAFLCGLRLI